MIQVGRYALTTTGPGAATWRDGRRTLRFGDTGPSLAAVHLVQVRSLGSMGFLYGPNTSHRLGWGTLLLLDPDGLVLARTRLTGWATARRDWIGPLAGLEGVEVRIDPENRSYTPKALCRSHPGALGLWPLRQDWSLLVAVLLALVTLVAIAPVAETDRGSEAVAVPVLVALAAATVLWVVRPTASKRRARALRRAARAPRT